uniref:Bifunctional inhibitor/plant lipid transfer protein/seed storage helical domain-containing protein n=1 Tax=Gossypium raimondii TaxID=29730 RepID=A0A0D2NVH6_GOSRA|nr:hypothetical protein B456_006G198900 [Gossypium raimondii]
MKRFSLIVLCVVTLVVVLFSGAETTPAPKCDNPLEYSSCLNAYKKPPPSAGCCQKMKEQAPCYYFQLVNYRHIFINGRTIDILSYRCKPRDVILTRDE